MEHSAKTGERKLPEVRILRMSLKMHLGGTKRGAPPWIAAPRVYGRASGAAKLDPVAK